MLASRSYSSTMTKASTKKAIHTGNQEALDRLNEKYETASSTNYGQSIRRAMKSLRECPTEILTLQDAMSLKFVGPALAKLMIPNVTITANRQPFSSMMERQSFTTMVTITKVSNEPSASALAKQSLKQPPPSVCNTKSTKQRNHEAAVAAAESLVLPTKGWKVTLLIDGREQRADHVQAKLQMSGVPCEQRHLPIGDMAWIATSGSIEVMLGTIVERKQVDDLASSLFGTRYLEQRLRLQHCGVPQVIFLVEGDVTAVANCSADTLRMAMMETRVQLNFQVHQTNHLDDTVRFLKLVHRRILQRAFPSAFGDTGTTSLPSFGSQMKSRKKKKKSLIEMLFDIAPVPPLDQRRFITYEELKSKVLLDREQGTRTLRAIYCGMLKQIPTLSHKKVLAIAKAYPTPNALLQAYQGLSEEVGKALLADLDTAGDLMERICRVGPKSSIEVYHVFTQVGITPTTLAVSSLSTRLKQTIMDQDDTSDSSPEKLPMTKVPSRKLKIDSSIPDLSDSSVGSIEVAATVSADGSVSDFSDSSSAKCVWDRLPGNVQARKDLQSTNAVPVTHESMDNSLGCVDLTQGDDDSTSSQRVAATGPCFLESPKTSQSSSDESLLVRMTKRQQSFPFQDVSNQRRKCDGVIELDSS